jgi:RNA polymerase sigma-70 factor, ECF subfamily
VFLERPGWNLGHFDGYLGGARRLAHPITGPPATQDSVTSRAVSPTADLTSSPDLDESAREQFAVDFEAIYAGYAQFAWRALARLGVPSEHLADATQDVFVVVHRRLGEFEQRSSVKTWLFGIAARVARGYARTARRRPSEPLPAGLPDGHLEAPFEQAARSQAVALLYQLLERLSADQRAVFVLVELEQLSLPEAAAALDANLHTVTSRLKAARRQFEAALRRHRAKHPIEEP